MDNQKNLEIAKKPMTSTPSLAHKSPTHHAPASSTSSATHTPAHTASASHSSPAATVKKAEHSTHKTASAPSRGNASNLRNANSAAKKNQTAGKGTARKAATTAKGTRAAAANVVNLGTSNMRGAMEKGALETRKMQDKASEMSREGAAKFSRQADKANRTMGEMSSIAKSHMEACMESRNIAADMTRKISSELAAFANDMVTRNVEISKNLFTCRTVNDLFDLQTKMVRSNMDNFFNESSKISAMMFSYVSQAREPISESMQNASKRLGKTIAA